MNSSFLADITTLKTHPRNPRQGDIGAIHESINTNGFYGAIIVQRSTNFVLAGNHRLLALRQKQEKQIPVIYVDVDDTQAKRIMLVDNKTNDKASYDNDILAEILQGLVQESEFGLKGTGYDESDLNQILKDLTPYVPQNQTSKEGTENTNSPKENKTSARTVPLMITLTLTEFNQWKELRKEFDTAIDNEVFVRLMEFYNQN